MKFRPLNRCFTNNDTFVGRVGVSSCVSRGQVAVKHTKRKDYGTGQALSRLQPVSIQLASYC